MKKLGLHRPQVDLVRYAAERGLIKPMFDVVNQHGDREESSSLQEVQTRRK